MPAKAAVKKFRFNQEETPEIEAGVNPAGVEAGSSTGQPAKSSSRRSAAKKNPAGAGSAATGEAEVSEDVMLDTADHLQSKMFHRPFAALSSSSSSDSIFSISNLSCTNVIVTIFCPSLGFLKQIADCIAGARIYVEKLESFS